MKKLIHLFCLACVLSSCVKAEPPAPKPQPAPPPRQYEF